MTVVIKKSDSKAVMKKKLNTLRNLPPLKKQRSFKELCGALKDVFKEDAVLLQRKWRSEWD